MVIILVIIAIILSIIAYYLIKILSELKEINKNTSSIDFGLFSQDGPNSRFTMTREWFMKRFERLLLLITKRTELIAKSLWITEKEMRKEDEI